jgi:hypothetical protein
MTRLFTGDVEKIVQSLLSPNLAMTPKSRRPAQQEERAA